MLGALARYWWVMAVRGVCAIVFGILALIWPGPTLLVVIALVGAFMLVDGIFAVIAGFTARGAYRRWWAIVLEGVAGCLLGVATFVWPDATALVLLYVIAAWAIITGGLEIVAAIQLRRELSNEWVLIAGGLASIALGVVLIVNPGAGALGLTWLIGTYAIVFGIVLLVLALRLRALRRDVERIGVGRPSQA